MRQDNNETLEHYVIRLTRKAACCNFILPVGKSDYTEKMIQHQLLHGLADTELQKSVLNDSDMEQAKSLQGLLDLIEMRTRSGGSWTISYLPKMLKETTVRSASAATSTFGVDCSISSSRNPDPTLYPKTSASLASHQRACDESVESNHVRFLIDEGGELTFKIRENKYFCTTCSSEIGAIKGLAKSSVRLHARTKHCLEIKSWTRWERRAARLEAVHRCPTCPKECRRAKVTKGFEAHINKCALKRQRLGDKFMKEAMTTTGISAITMDKAEFDYTLAVPIVPTNDSDESMLPASPGINAEEAMLDIPDNGPAAIDSILKLNGETLVQVGGQQIDWNPQDVVKLPTSELQIFEMGWLQWDEDKIEDLQQIGRKRKRMP